MQTPGERDPKPIKERLPQREAPIAPSRILQKFHINKYEEQDWNAKKLPNPYERGEFFYKGKAVKHVQA